MEPALKHTRLRRQLIETARSIHSTGLGIGNSGNVSVRIAGGFLITPSGVAYEKLRPADIVEMHPDGTPVSALLRPSSEWRFHRDIYRSRSDAGAIVHTHSPHATALACLRKGIPAFHYMVAVAGGDSIRCAPYATFGSARLATLAVRALRDRQACLLANHGQIALAADPAAALDMAREVEELARQYWLAVQLGSPVLLRRAEMRTVLRKFRHYGARGATSREPGGRS